MPPQSYCHLAVRRSSWTRVLQVPYKITANLVPVPVDQLHAETSDHI